MNLFLFCMILFKVLLLFITSVHSGPVPTKYRSAGKQMTGIADTAQLIAASSQYVQLFHHSNSQTWSNYSSMVHGRNGIGSQCKHWLQQKHFQEIWSGILTNSECYFKLFLIGVTNVALGDTISKF